MTSSEPAFEEACIIRAPLSSQRERRSIDLHPQRPSRPFAILTWGCRPESTVHGVQIGMRQQLLRSMPGSWFSSLLSLEEFDGLCERRPDGHDAVRALWRLFGYERLEMERTEFGSTITLDVSGPFERLLLLAHMPEWTEWDRQFETAKRRAALQ